MPSPESSSGVSSHQEMRINDPEALVTTAEQSDFKKSDVVEFGVNTFIELPKGLEIIRDRYETTDKSSKEKRQSAIKKALAAATAFLALAPAGLVRSVSTDTQTTWEAQTVSTTTSHTVELPVDHTSTVQSHEWDASKPDNAAAKRTADDIRQAIQKAEQDALDKVPVGGRITSMDASVDIHTKGGADDSHRVGPESDNQNLGEKDAYNQQLAEERADKFEALLEGELSDEGVTIDRSTSSGEERVLDTEQIQNGNEMADKYGYGDFDELIQAVEHGRIELDAQDQERYDQMITNARNTTVDASGNVAVTYETTEQSVEEVPVKNTTTREDLVGVPNGFVGIATEERPMSRAGSKSRGGIVPIPRTGDTGSYLPGRSSVYPSSAERLSKQARRGVTVSQRSFGGGSIRKINGATFRGGRQVGAFLANSR